MKELNWKNAFGSTPMSVKACVRRSLREGERRKPMFSSLVLRPAVLLSALLLVLGSLFVGRARLARNGGPYTDTKRPVKTTLSSALSAFESETLRLDVRSCRYDPENGAYILNWDMKPRAEGDRLFVVCRVCQSGEEFYAERLLLRGATACVLSCVPQEETEAIPLEFTVFRVKGEILPENTLTGEPTGDWRDEARLEERVRAATAEGKLVITSFDSWGDLLVPDYDHGKTYEENLIEMPGLSLAEAFSLSVNLREIAKSSRAEMERVISFEVEGGLLRVTGCWVDTTLARVTAELITPEKPGTLPVLEAGGTWFKTGFSRSGDPERLDDGSCRTPLTWEATGIHWIPESLTIRLNGEETGEIDLSDD